MNNLDISEIQITPIKPRNGHVAFATIVINNQFYVGDIAIYTSPSTKYGYRVVYPDKRMPNGKRVNCFHPISSEVGDYVTKEIIRKYEELMDNFNHVGA